MRSKSQITKGEVALRWQYHELRRELMRKLAARLGRARTDAPPRTDSCSAGPANGQPKAQGVAQDEPD